MCEVARVEDIFTCDFCHGAGWLDGEWGGEGGCGCVEEKVWISEVSCRRNDPR